MRTFKDRMRHALTFEVTALLIITPLGALLFDMPLFEIGTAVLVGSLIATVWTYFYNLGFDRVMLRRSGSVEKTLLIRIVHSVAFEAGLLLILMPYFAWHLGITLLEALTLDISFAAFYLVYAFAYNWIYDLVFPIPAGNGSQVQTATLDR